MSIVTHETSGYRFFMSNYEKIQGTIILKRYDVYYSTEPLKWIITDRFYPEVSKPNGNTLENYIKFFTQYLRECEEEKIFNDISPLVNSFRDEPLQFEPSAYSYEDETTNDYYDYSSDEDEENYNEENKICDGVYREDSEVVFTTHKSCQEFLSLFSKERNNIQENLNEYMTNKTK
jgi:hypothetical protein